MNRTEALEILQGFAAAWPSKDHLTDDTIELWVVKLADIDFERGMETASLLIDESQWFPTVAEFRKRNTERAASRSVPTFAALPAPPVSVEEQQANLGKVKRLLGKVGTEVKIAPEYRGKVYGERDSEPPPFCTAENHDNCGPDHDPSAVIPRGLSTSKKRAEMAKIRERQEKAEERDQRTREIAQDAAREVAQSYLGDAG